MNLISSYLYEITVLVDHVKTGLATLPLRLTVFYRFFLHPLHSYAPLSPPTMRAPLSEIEVFY